MSTKDYLLSVVLSGVYILLTGFLAGYTATWGDPTWWYQFWESSASSAVSWMQIVHSLGVVLAALPIAGLLAWKYRTAWIPPTSIAAILASFLFMLDQILGTWLLIDMDIQPTTCHLLSGGIDTVKVGLILIFITALLQRLPSASKLPSA